MPGQHIRMTTAGSTPTAGVPGESLPVAAVVVTFNSAPTIADCVRSILASTIVRELVVVDNCSADDTLSRLREFRDERLRVIEMPRNAGFARASNEGTAVTTSPLIAFINPVYKHILRRREVYTLTNHKLEMRFGLFSKIVRNIPLRNIQDVTVTASVWQRLLKLGDIEIDSASETGKIILEDIHHPDRYANMILGELRRRN